MEKPIVLLIEDDEVLNASLCEVLADDYQAECVMTLADGLASIARRVPACIVLDHNLPDGTGDLLLMQITREGRAVPTVLVSAAVAARGVAERFGIAHVPKPFDIDQLLAAIDLAITRPIIPVDALR